MKEYQLIQKTVDAEQVTKRTRVSCKDNMGDVYTRYAFPGEWIVYELLNPVRSVPYPKVMSDADFKATYEEKS